MTILGQYKVLSKLTESSNKKDMTDNSTKFSVTRQAIFPNGFIISNHKVLLKIGFKNTDLWFKIFCDSSYSRLGWGSF